MTEQEEKKLRRLRITNFVLGVALAGVAIYAYTLYSNATNVDKIVDAYKQYEEQVAIDEELLAYFRAQKNKPIHPTKTGGFISRDEAKRRLDSLKTWGVLRRQPYGFTFGLENVRSFIKQIDAQNVLMTDQNDTTNLITGVRVYLIRKLTKGKPHLDVMIGAGRRNGVNYIPLGDVGDDPKIAELAKLTPNPLLLDTSSPCPDMCDDDDKNP